MQRVLGVPRRRDALVILGLVLLAIAAGLPGVWQPIDRDVAAYATIGARMRLGDLPYRDLFDHKQPLIYAVYWFLATIAPRSTIAIRLTGVLFLAFSGALVFMLLRRALGTARAALAAALVVVFESSSFVEGVGLNTEHLLVPLSIAAVLWPWSQHQSPGRWLPFVAGILGGLVILAKAIGVFVLPAALLVLILGRTYRGQSILRTAVTYLLGLALPILAIAVFYAWQGALPQFIYANLSYNIQYVRWSGGSLISRANLFSIAGPIDSLRIAAMLVAVHVLITEQGKNLLAWTGLIWLLGAWQGANLGGRVFPHYLAPIVPPAVILLCLPIHWRLLPRRVGSLALLVLIVAVSVPFVKDVAGTYGYSPDELAVRLYGQEASAWIQQESAGDWLENRASPSDSLFVSGAEPGFYWSSGLEPATRYLYDYPRLIEEGFDTMVNQALTENPPRFLVVPNGMPPPYMAGLARLPYQEVARFDTVEILELPASYVGSQQPSTTLDAVKSYEAYINDSLTFYYAGDFQKSVEAGQQALRLRPDSAVAYNNICSAYNALHQWDKAVEACQQALAIQPDFELAKNNLRVAEQRTP